MLFFNRQHTTRKNFLDLYELICLRKDICVCETPIYKIFYVIFYIF